MGGEWKVGECFMGSVWACRVGSGFGLCKIWVRVRFWVRIRFGVRVRVRFWSVVAE